MSQKILNNYYGRILLNYRAAIYPILILLIFSIFVLCKISGSSIGIYNTYLYGSNAKDSNLIYGKPQAIRSDEWLVTTQLTIAQKENDYSRINNNFMGRDMSVLTDAPYRDWSSFFKPQNFSFFMMPFEYAFAFKWWLLLVVLMMGSYFFSLKLLRGQVLTAVLCSLTISFSPFVFWWYQTATIAPLAYGFLILLVGMSIIDRTPLSFRQVTIDGKLSSAFKTAALTYLLGCFGLVFYPPFQIPIAICVAFFLIGYLLNQKRDRKAWKQIAPPFLVAFLLTVTVGGLFVASRQAILHTATNTAYPGKRVVASGGYDIKKLLVTYLQPQLQRDERGAKYDKNQSESSNFILLPLFFLVPAIALFVWLYVKQNKFEWVLFAIILCNLLFLAHLFLPGIDFFTTPFLLSIVPHDRLFIGLGFLAIILLLYMIHLYQQYKLKINPRLLFSLALYSVLFLIAVVWAGIETSHAYPDFISSKKLILLLAVVVIAGFGLIITGKIRSGLVVVCLFTIASVIFIHPLYRGLGPIYNSAITKTIQEISDQNATWAAAQSITIENLPQMSGRPAITGVSAYPSTTFWHKNTNTKDDRVYNRYAHIILSSNDTNELILVGPDLFAVSASCTRKVSQKIDYVISTTPLEGNCENLVRTLYYPNATFYFYKQ